MKKRHLLKLCAMTGLLQLSSMATAQTYPEFHVFGEKDDSDNTECRASNVSAVAAVEAALRNNRIVITSKKFGKNVVSAYVNIIALQNNNGTCHVSYSLQLYDMLFTTDNFTQKIFIGKVVFCDRGALASGSPQHVYSEMQSTLPDFANQCVTEYLNTVNSSF